MPPTSPIFLYGNVSNNFRRLSAPFVRACGGRSAKIALLMLPHSEEYVPRYRQTWLRAGAGEVTPIFPPASLVVQEEQLRTLRRSTGVFMSGGPTELYQRSYGTRAVARTIRGLHDSGVPYGGVSAGAMMACEDCVVEDSTGPTRAIDLRRGVDRSRSRGEAKRPGLVVKRGLGLVARCVLEPHFTESGRLPRLVEAMTLAGSRFGIGIDEPTCLELRGAKATVRGRGRLYLFRRDSRGRRGAGFRFRSYEPGSRFEFSDED